MMMFCICFTFNEEGSSGPHLNHDTKSPSEVELLAGRRSRDASRQQDTLLELGEEEGYNPPMGRGEQAIIVANTSLAIVA